MNLTTYLRAGYPGLALISSEEARAEADIAAACASVERRLHAWSSTDGLVDTTDGRVAPCPDPLELFDGAGEVDGAHGTASLVHDPLHFLEELQIGRVVIAARVDDDPVA